MKEIVLALLKSEKGLCAMAFLLALLVGFETTIFHALDWAKDAGLFARPAIAATLEGK